MNPFKEIGLDNWIINMCEKLNYQRPTEIQLLGIPNILRGQNVIANAETGSGKTAMFSFPILQKLAKDPYGIFALVLAPNRELALQITEQLSVFGVSLNLRVCTLVGGIDLIKQNHEISKIPHIVVATPGRLLDLLQTQDILQEYIQNIAFVVFDEADRLIDPSIMPDIKSILKFLPQQRQTILTSATINKKDFDQTTLQILSPQNTEFIYHDVNQQLKTVKTLTQNYILMPSSVKQFYFVNLCKKFDGISSIVFVATCKLKAQTLHLLLNQLGFSTSCLHSKLKQRQRNTSIKKFKNSRVKILIATDVASRYVCSSEKNIGLDIPMVDLVINYDIPRATSDYVHRVGRTARKGQRGLAISLLTQFDIQLIQSIEKNIGEKLSQMTLNEEAVMESVNDIIKAKKKVKIIMSESGMEQLFVKKNKK